MSKSNIDSIKALLARHGFRFSKSMGQNFLIDESVPERIAALSGIDGAGVLEVGPGIGALTAQLCKHAAKVVSVELDSSLLPLLDETLDGYRNVEIINADILKTDICRLLDSRFPDLRRCACANLPYNITTPVLTKLIGTGAFDSITVMVQREVALRMCAKPASSEYGAFSVFVAYHTQPEILFDVPPSSFLPQPKVYSSVITLRRRSEPAQKLADEEMFFRVVRASFAQRRKTLQNGLSSVFGSKLKRDEISDIITGCGFDARIRGETLGIPEFAAIAAGITERLNGK